MSQQSQLFVATHAAALAYSEDLDSGTVPDETPESAPIGELTDFEIEALGRIAARTVHASGIDCELELVDVAHEALFAVPGPLTDVFAELGELEDADELLAVAKEWQESEEMEGVSVDAAALVERLADLAATARDDAALELYVWTAESA